MTSSNDPRELDLLSPEAQVVALRSELDDLRLILDTLIVGLAAGEKIDQLTFSAQSLHRMPSGRPWNVGDALAPSHVHRPGRHADRVRVALATNYYAEDVKRDVARERRQGGR